MSNGFDNRFVILAYSPAAGQAVTYNGSSNTELTLQDYDWSNPVPDNQAWQLVPQENTGGSSNNWGFALVNLATGNAMSANGNAAAPLSMVEFAFRSTNFDTFGLIATGPAYLSYAIQSNSSPNLWWGDANGSYNVGDPVSLVATTTPFEWLLLPCADYLPGRSEEDAMQRVRRRT